MNKIHLINPMWSCTGGSEWRTYELYRLLSSVAEVKVWSPKEPATGWLERLPIHRINPWRLQIPRGGTIIFVGIYYHFSRWLRLSQPQRVIIVYNTPSPDLFYARRKRLIALGYPPVEVVYASQWLRDSLAIDGPVQLSPINLERFAPPPTPMVARLFTVGRMSRDVKYKHHSEDLVLYNRLSEQDINVRVMGGMCLSGQGHPARSVEVLPEGAEDAVAFLRSLDCFFYRTGDSWCEPHGRVVQEAMACGLPVVCGRRGGHAEYIKHGVNGFLFDDTSEAEAILSELQRDPNLRLRVGHEARKAMESLFSFDSLQRVRNFYTKQPC